MSRNYALFSTPAAFERIAKRLVERSRNDLDNKLSTQDARNILLIEIGFRLFELLGIEDENVTTPWVILSGMPLYEPRLAKLDSVQRRAIANARQLIPYSARFAWQNALRHYSRVAGTYRNYELAEPEWKKQPIIDAKKPESESTFDPSRQVLYDEWLKMTLPFKTKKLPAFARSGVTYQFDARVQSSEKDYLKVPVNIGFKANQIDNILKPSPSWFNSRPEPVSFVVKWSELEAETRWLTERENALHEQWGSKMNGWVKRFEGLDLRTILPNGSVNPEKSAELTITEFMHLAGMVASGKSTLAQLLAVFIARHRPQQRLTIIVGDVQTAIQWANQLNTWLCDDPETDTPIAVPLFGRSMRSNHIRSFYRSQEYLQFSQRQQPHWGERWLSSLCPLQAYLPDNTVIGSLNNQLIITGQEPCNRLSLKETSEEDIGDNEPSDEIPKQCACPFIGVCPQYQAIRDMPTAPIWITTPGGFNSRVPVQFDNRPISLGEIIYEQSDLVIVDEADAVINWFDNQFAETLYLTGSDDSLLDKVAIPSIGYVIRNRVMPPATARWIGGQQSAQLAVSAMLTLLDPFQGRDCLRRWVANHYFTPLHLFDRLATRLAGLEEVASPDLTEDQHKARTERIQPIRDLFNILLNDDERLETDQPKRESEQSAYELSRILQVINGLSDSATSSVVHQQCINWIKRHFSNIEALLNDLKQQLIDHQQQQVITAKRRRKPNRKQEVQVDTIDTLAYRLQFALTVLLLDHHNRTVLYEWDNRPHTIQDDSPAYRRNTVLRSLLPLPLTGRQFGTYYARGEAESELKRRSEPQTVSLFAYTNIGRAYILNFHRLLTDYTGRQGPNVLAMSGTSYLPDSTTFHVGNPQAILLPSTEAETAIKASHFHFCWQESSIGEPIRVSGNLQRGGISLFTELANALAGHNGSGLVQRILNELEEAAMECPNHWQDRQRILLFVNSYEQAYWAALALQEAIPAQKNAIKFLTNGGSPYNQSPHAVLRTDIEQFAQTNGRLLIAPMSAIGRGFNILNQYNKAAFGAVFFLTRPYPHPHDTQSIARELNRRADEWANDPTYEAWAFDGLGGKAEEIRKRASRYWRLAESRTYYRTLRDVPELTAKPRLDLAATTIGYLIQAVGRLIRGNVPFKAYFIDAAWAPEWTKANQPESSRTSLLAAIIETLTNYVADDPICEKLYGSLADRFDWIENFERSND
ncbi:pPIWI_RE_Z domain-containing protein [Spirosoma litoris]